MADENSFRGSMAELLEAVARDGSQPIDIRLSCANALLRTAPPSGDEALAKMSEAELERELRRLEEQRRAAVVIGEATVVEPEPTQPISNALMDARLRAKLED